MAGRLKPLARPSAYSSYKNYRTASMADWQIFVSKLNIYRTCVVAFLATAAFLWPVILYGLGLWFAGALFSLALEKATTSEMKTATLFDPDHLGLLAAWRGVWNSFYVWKDLDQDYWRSSTQARETDPPSRFNDTEQQTDRATPDA
jgi:hypothetical protein